jgi:hypothetical protein
VRRAAHTIKKGWPRWPTLFLVVPEVGIEPTWMQDPLDFESDISRINKANDFNKYYDFISFIIVY